MSTTTRTCGILLHPTSLPGPFGIGSIGRNALRFIDFLVDAGQGVWQILPLGPTGYGDSPYACLSTFAGNPLLIDLDELIEQKLIDRADLKNAPSSRGTRVDYESVAAFKRPLLSLASERFASRGSAEQKAAFSTFCTEEAWWLEDFALFVALKKSMDGKPVTEWPTELRRRDPKALVTAKKELAGFLNDVRFQQFTFFRQWELVRQYANARNVKILGDLPIFVAYDSADVWAHPELFKLDEDLVPPVVAGVPPDYFSATGQLWGNPLYDWPAHEMSGFAWWINRMKMALRLADVVRLDHFRGFEAAWEVPAHHETAINGKWVKGPGDSFFDALRNHFGSLPLVAEDLGIITDEVYALRDRHNLPGMHVLHFGFSPNDERIYAPHRCRENAVCYTGTHDNDTTVGWFRCLSDAEKAIVKEYLRTDGSDISWALMRCAYSTVAHTVIVPLQDVLGLDSDGRMNLPGLVGSNWSFRMGEQLSEQCAKDLRHVADLYERSPSKKKK